MLIGNKLDAEEERAVCDSKAEDFAKVFKLNEILELFLVKFHRILSLISREFS